MPAKVVASGKPTARRWSAFGISPFAAVLALAISLGMTFYGWRIAVEDARQHAQGEFATLAQENESALQTRLDSYRYALLGAAGFFQGSDKVTQEEWRRYVEALELKRNFPGMNGLGWVAPAGAKYLITYIEPLQANYRALGLDIAAEQNRREAAELARDSGTTAITRRITLVQDDTRSAGFLLLHPLFERGRPTATAQERQQALRGWIYAPFVASHFLEGLTDSQGDTLELAIYDGGAEDPSKLIYGVNTQTGTQTGAGPASFVMRKQMNVMQQQWLLVWKSTPAFDRLHRTESPLLILAGGLMFTGLLALFLLVTAAQREGAVNWLAEERKFSLPFTIFIVAAGGAFYLYHTLYQREIAVIQAAVEEEAKKIGQIVSFQTSDKMMSLKRMAQRWEAAGGTPEDQWRADAVNYTSQLSGLQTVEWVDDTYHIRWAEPVQGNEKAIGLNILFDKQRAAALKGARERRGITLTPPLDLVQGYKAFIAYVPIHIGERFDGFVAGVFAIDTFFGTVLGREVTGDYRVALSYGGREFFRNSGDAPQGGDWSRQREFRVYDKTWSLHIEPTRQFIKNRMTMLPGLVLASGLLIAVLLALTVRYVLISRLRALQQEKVERMKQQFIAVVSHELRTPVTAIRGPLGILSGPLKQELSPKAAELIEMAERNSERLGLLIDDILDIEKLESGELDVNPIAVPVASFLHQALEVNRSYGEKFNVRFELEAAPPEAQVLADPDRLMQVMSNLLSNASKFSPNTAVAVRAREDADAIHFEVQDRGEGIPEEFRSRIFQKFAQADGSSTRRFKGTGLGLAITRQLIEKMGGTITFTSAVGDGTTFHFALPKA